MSAHTTSPTAPAALFKMPAPPPVHPRAPVPFGVRDMNVFVRLDGKLLALRCAQLTRRRIAELYAGCPELLAATWPSRRAIGGWDARDAAEAIICACGHAGIAPVELLLCECIDVRYRWRTARGRYELVTPQELQRRTERVLGSAQ